MDIHGDGNIVGNNNRVEVSSDWAVARERAQEAVRFHQQSAGSLQAWAIGLLFAGLLLPGILASFVGQQAIWVFGVLVVFSVGCNFKAQTHRKEATRLWNYYGLF